VCIDRRRQWRNAGQIRHNSLVRTMMHSVTSALARKRQPVPGPR
jgi:hypothetical protein